MQLASSGFRGHLYCARCRTPELSTVVGSEDFNFLDGIQARIDQTGDQVAGICQANANKCAVTVTETSRSRPVPFTSNVPDLIETTAATLDFRRMRILSGAGHDAMHLAKICPTGMIFVPCENGVSHAEIENATPGDLAAGTRVLTAALVDLANA